MPIDDVAVALFDPSSRVVIPFVPAKAQADDGFVHQLRYPNSRALASTFTPDFIFGGAVFENTNDAVRASLYRGAGHSGDLTATLGTPQAPGPDRIQALGPGTVEFGTTIGPSWGDMAFWAGRVSDGVSNTRLMAVASYAGNGATSRAVSLNLNNKAPALVLVVPNNSSARVYRVTGDSAGRNVSGATVVNNSVTALAPDQITVGTALNAVGVTYDVWAITTGFVPPQ